MAKPAANPDPVRSRACLLSGVGEGWEQLPLGGEAQDVYKDAVGLPLNRSSDRSSHAAQTYPGSA